MLIYLIYGWVGGWLIIRINQRDDLIFAYDYFLIKNMRKYDGPFLAFLFSPLQRLTKWASTYNYSSHFINSYIKFDLMISFLNIFLPYFLTNVVWIKNILKRKIRIKTKSNLRGKKTKSTLQNVYVTWMIYSNNTLRYSFQSCKSVIWKHTEFESNKC